MALWKYVGSQSTGQKVKGKLIANSEGEARRRLADMSIECSRLELVDESKPKPWPIEHVGGFSGASNAAIADQPGVPPSPEVEKRVMGAIDGLAGTREIANQMGRAKLPQPSAPKRRETIIINESSQVAAQAERLLAARDGHVKHAAMALDAKGWLRVMLVIEHDCEEG